MGRFLICARVYKPFDAFWFHHCNADYTAYLALVFWSGTLVNWLQVPIDSFSTLNLNAKWKKCEKVTLLVRVRKLPQCCIVLPLSFLTGWSHTTTWQSVMSVPATSKSSLLVIQYTYPNTTNSHSNTSTKLYEPSQTHKLYLNRNVFSTMALDILYGAMRHVLGTKK